jgi:hypothetical protein
VPAWRATTVRIGQAIIAPIKALRWLPVCAELRDVSEEVASGPN